MKKKSCLHKIANRLFGLSILLAVLLAGCKKEARPHPLPTTKIKGPFLYVGGSAKSVGTYLKISLSQPNVAVITDTIAKSVNINSIVTSGDDVYIATQTGGYWKNDSFVPVSGASNISYLAVSKNTIYSLGFDNLSSPAYWSNNTEINLGNTIGRNLFPYQGGSADAITGISILNNDVLVSGWLAFENDSGAPPSAPYGNFGLIWKNGAPQLLGPEAGKGKIISFGYNSTIGIATLGNDAYVAGRLPDTTYAGGYWKNGVWNPINNGKFYPYAITSSATDVYIAGITYDAGYTNQQIVYWQNGTLNYVENASMLIAMVSDSSDVYICGIDRNKNVVIWKNTSLFKVIGPSVNNIMPSCMAIGN